MANFKDLSNLPRDLLKQWQALTLRTRVGIVAAVALSVAVLAYVTALANHVDYAPLYVGISAEDAAAVLDKLHEGRIPYQISHGGDTIEVPRSQVAETRLTLAGLGLPRGGATGFELFDKQGLGISEFTQRVNYNRAMSGELERSIATLAAVQKARVHLVVPEKSLFRSAEQQASASVVLQLHAGRTLSAAQVQGIVHLVASSVEGLQPERVTVLDGRGEVLSQKNGKEAQATQALAYQREVENKYTQAAQDLLEKTLGHGHAAVQVSARVDTAQAERTREEYDPDQQVVRSEQETEDTVGAAADSAGGVAGARGNLPGGPPPQTSPGEGTHRKTTVRNYEVGRNVSKVTEPGGRVERLTVAVLVDGSYAPAGPRGKDGAPPKERKFIPRTQQEMDNYAAIVREAVGFDAKRGDQIEVRCVPFAAGPEGDGLDMTEVKDIIPPWGYALLGAALLGLGATLMHLLRRRREVTTFLPQGMHLPSSVAQIEEGMRSHEVRALPDPNQTQDRQLAAAKRAREHAVEMITAQPERSVQVLRAWINQHESDSMDNDKEEPRAVERT